MPPPAPPADRPLARLAPYFVALAAVGAIQAGAWLYYRARQRDVDDRTGDRLAPRVG